MSTSEYNPSMQPHRVRVVTIFHPIEGITFEQFSKYWLEEHGKKFMSLKVVKENLTKYEQFHFDTSLSAGLAAAMECASSPFWGMSIFEAESYEKIQEVFTSSEYAAVCLPDEKHILDRSKSQVLAGQFGNIYEPKN